MPQPGCDTPTSWMRRAMVAEVLADQGRHLADSDDKPVTAIYRE